MAQLDTTYKDYPNYLKHLNHIERKNAPETLYCEGDISLLTSGVRVSIVGSIEKRLSLVLEEQQSLLRSSLKRELLL